MQKIIVWIKANKLTALLLLIVAYFLFRNYLPFFNRSAYRGEIQYSDLATSTAKLGTTSQFLPPAPQESVPAPEVKDRLVIRESTLSLLVKKVADIQKAISQKAEQLGGYMVNTTISHPEEAAAANGSIIVRIPQPKLDEVLDYFRSLAVKVVSENISGQDVTDQYVDIEARVGNLNKTKAKFEEILAKAIKVEEILQVQRELVNLQEQIDNLKGQQNYLEKSAQMSKITVYLSTDELALPYAPTQAWRPAVILRKAVRSLVATARKVGTAIIWLAVYSVIWVPALIIYLVLRRRKKTA